MIKYLEQLLLFNHAFFNYPIYKSSFSASMMYNSVQIHISSLFLANIDLLFDLNELFPLLHDLHLDVFQTLPQVFKVMFIREYHLVLFELFPVNWLELIIPFVFLLLN